MLLGLPACELQEVTVVEIEDVIIAEVYVQLEMPAAGVAPTESTVRAFLHRTVDGSRTAQAVPGAVVTITREDGSTLTLAETDLTQCLEIAPTGGNGSCYLAPPAVANGLLPGERLALDVGVPDGRVLRSITRVPGAFVVEGVDGGMCALAPDTPFEMRWTRSEGAWAYLNETSIVGLADALAPEGIESSDPLYLLGLSVAADDTTIVFPNEFGLFDRFDLDQALAVRLQRGLPSHVSADVTITATDRNYVNWVRGGSFNPSGQVRVPSMVGDGSGVFASTLTRAFVVDVRPLTPTSPVRCPGT